MQYFMLKMDRPAGDRIAWAREEAGGAYPPHQHKRRRLAGSMRIDSLA
jgi:hypothetical protein